MKLFFLVSTLFLFSLSSAVSMDLKNQRESLNIETLAPVLTELRPLDSLKKFVVENKGTLSKVKESAIGPIRDKINSMPARAAQSLPDCDQVYFAMFPDGSSMLVQVTKDEQVIMFTKLLINPDGFQELKKNFSPVMDNLEVVVAGGTNV
jgi:hypothetical protein